MSFSYRQRNKKKCTQTLQGSNKGENPNIKVKLGVISRINTER